MISAHEAGGLLISPDTYLGIQAAATDAAESWVRLGLESAVSLAQSLSQWAYLIIGASVALLFKDLDKRPKNGFIRWSFLAFIPGWAFLVATIYKGMRVHEAYTMYLLRAGQYPKDGTDAINADAACQIQALRWGIGIFIVWSSVYLLWWVMHREAARPE